LLLNQGETTCFSSVISLIRVCLLFELQKQQTPPFHYCFTITCYERLVDHCSLGDDLGSHYHNILYFNDQDDDQSYRVVDVDYVADFFFSV